MGNEMLKTGYESRADTIQITLDDVDRLSGGSDVIDDDAVIVGISDGRAAMVDVIGTRGHDFEKSLRIAAEQHDLDTEALIAISRATLAAPDRPVRLELGDRIVD
jgi:acetyl-CoA carboxylase alpha subunit